MKLTNAHLNKIYWAIFSPSLLSYPFSANYIKDDEHKASVLMLLQELDAASNQVNEYFSELGKMPMGKYFEQLLFYILNQDNRYERLLQNHQILEEKRTVGEIDLILKDTKTGEMEHWEIALKFYLQSQCSREHSEMIGPNAADNLARKIKKLTEYQLPIRSNLGDVGIRDTSQVSNKLLLKGQFFYHISHTETCNIFPNHVNPAHESGWWCHLSQVEKTLDKNLIWITIEKPNWIGKAMRTINHNSLNYNELKDLLKQHFQHDFKSILCVGLKEVNGVLQECSRGFVVHNAWPQDAKN